MSYIIYILPSWSTANNFMEKLNVICAYAICAFGICIIVHMFVNCLFMLTWRLSVPQDIKAENRLEVQTKKLCTKLNLDYSEQLDMYNGDVSNLYKYLQTVQAWR